MTLIVVGACMLVLIAILLVAIPLIRKSSRTEQDVLTNTQVIRQRIAELEKEVDEGVLSEQDKQQSIDELKLALLDESSEEQDRTAKHRLPVMLGLAVSVVVTAVVYFNVNQISKIENWQNAMDRLPELSQRIVVDADQTIQPQDLEEFALGIRTRLLENPDDAIGWLLLGRIHASLNRLETALEAYERALRLSPDNVGVLSSYSQALILTGDERFMRQGISLLKKLVTLSPQDYNAIGMLAITATQLGQYELALENWRKLQVLMPESAPMRSQVNQRVEELQAMLNGNEPSVDPVAPQSVTDSVASAEATDGQAEGKSIALRVDLLPELARKLPANGFLFVFAQDAVSGSRMPAAVIKAPLEQLPVLVELSDANAMMANYTLSQLTKARLVARISADGNVAQAPGELEGEIVVELDSAGNEIQKILIDRELM